MLTWLEDWLVFLLRREMARQRQCMREALTDRSPARQARMLKEARRRPLWLRLMELGGRLV